MIPSRLSALCLLSILAGCTLQQQSTEPAPQAEDLFTRPLMPESVLRDGSRLQFALALPEEGSALVALDCAADKAELLYLDGAQRVYPGQVNAYAAPLPLSTAKSAALRQRADIAALCAQPANTDWRVLASSAGGDTLVIDRNSLVDGQGVRRFWGGQQLGVTVKTPRYGAPVRQWRESLAADCTARRYLLLARYGLDDSGRITDSEPARLTQEAFTTAPVERRHVLEAVCDHRDALLAAPRMPAVATTPAAAVPASTMASPTELPVAQPQPLQALQALALPAPRAAIQTVVEEGESRYAGQSHPYRQALQVSAGPLPGLFRFTAQGKAARMDALSWRGLIDLVRRTEVDNGGLPVEESASLTHLTFNGDWRALAVGSQVGYQAQQTLTGNRQGREQREIQVSCKVVAEGEARQLLASLSGRAKTLECRHGKASKGPLSHWSYLEDYGFFHMTSLGADDAMGLKKHLVELR
ncbi:hypothetical protein APT59_13950 [Pseudomonas oryzihabitans]|uniref:Lipoprotein n=1 Tax=Pseudomonas oryzihabitans TaxID=47885 RepID=A0A0U4XUS9_9PSED|nr:hypothetical protein [Pseudomonas oryzihabitans]ALZ85241.1 hypothetical protein APT59_13950 [Pseudomonas oryzihabitans]